jgi:serine/threonine-protein kinase
VPLAEPPTLADSDTGLHAPLPASGRFGRYELLGEVKAGGMGVVYKAHDSALGRIVALKLLKAGARASPNDIERFQREARAVGRLSHPHIVSIYDVSQYDGLYYLTMEYAAGGSLAQNLNRFRKDTAAAVALMEKVARATHFAHQRNILHRDLKAANILLDAKGEPRVSDFGLAKMLDGEPVATDSDPLADTDVIGDPADAGNVHTFGAVGTLVYMSPEQVSGQKATRASDIWALGVILYELLTPQRPFIGHSRVEVTEKIKTVEPPRPRGLRPELDPALEAICLKCLKKIPARRYASAEAMADDLARWSRRGLIARHPWTIAGLVAAALIALLAVLLRWNADGADEQTPPVPATVAAHIRQELVAGRPVVLVDKDGRFPWFKGRPHRDLKQIPLPIKDRAVTFQSEGIGILEFLSCLPCKSYTMRAEVRHDAADGASEVGLCLGDSKPDTAGGPEWCLTVAAFADQGDTFELRAGPNGPKWYAYELGLRRSSADERVSWQDRLTGTSFLPQAGRFRQLQVKITPDTFRIWWEDDELPPVSRPKVAREARSRLYYDRLERLPLGPMLNEFTKRQFDGELTFSDMIGLYVRQGAASFRNVVLEPGTVE